MVSEALVHGQLDAALLGLWKGRTIMTQGHGKG
jgi:hypothetical protein